MVHHFGNQALAFLDLDQRVNGKLNILLFLDIVEILAHILVEQEDLLKQVVEALDDLDVAFLEALVELGQLHRVVDHIVVSVGVLDVLKVEKHVQILCLL